MADTGVGDAMLACPHLLDEAGNLAGYADAIIPLSPPGDRPAVNLHLCDHCNAVLLSYYMDEIGRKLFTLRLKA